MTTSCEPLVRDADTKWEIYVNWTDWLTKKASDTGGVYTITGSAWGASDPSIVQETETPSTVTAGNLALFVGSGGANGQDYALTNTITYSSALTGATDMTEDYTIGFRMRDK